MLRAVSAANNASHSSPRMAVAVARLVRGFTCTRTRAAMVCLVGLLIGSGALAYGVTHIQLDTRLTSLLPDDAPSVSALDKLRDRKGSTEVLTVVAQSQSDAENAAMIEVLAEGLGRWEETLEVYTGRSYTPLRDAALYFLAPDDLEGLLDRLREERHRVVVEAVRPGLTDTKIDPSHVVVDSGSWDDEEEEDDDWNPGGARSSETLSVAADFDIRRWLTDKKSEMAGDGRLTTKEVDLIWPKEDERGELIWEEQVLEPYRNDGGDIRLLKAELSKPPTDIRFAREVSQRIAELVSAAQGRGVGTGVTVRVVSAYEVSTDVDTIMVDLTRATKVSAILVLGVLLIGFRSFRALFLILFPMSIAMAITLAIAAAVFGNLNALTAFLFAVLFGMGVDFAVHLFAQRAEQGEVADWGAIIEGHLRPLSSTMLTTVGCLFVLAAGTFKAFQEFGVISGIGVVVCFLCAIVFVPALDVFLGKIRAPKIGRHLRVIVLLCFGGVAIFGTGKVDFERDTRALTTATTRSAKKSMSYGSATGRCSKTLVLVADTAEDLNTVVERLEHEKGTILPGAIDPPEGEEARPWIMDVYSVHKLLPEAADSKFEILQKINGETQRLLTEISKRGADSRGYLSHLEALDKLSSASPLKGEDLPKWALAPFSERDNHFDRIGHLCMSIRSYHLDELVAVSDHLAELTEGTSTRTADSRLVFADLIGLVEADAQRLPLLALLVILVLIGIDLRSIKSTLICFTSLGLGLGLSLGVMGIWPLHINFFNLAVMPAVVGLGIDASIHLWHARETRNLKTTGKASLLAALTTVAGFSGMLVAKHPGLHSIGEIGVLSIVLCVGVAFLMLYPFNRDRL